MPQYRIVVKAIFYADVYADDEDDAWTAGDDLDPDDMKCSGWETLNVTEIE